MITDDKFIQQSGAEESFNQKSFDRAALAGIGNKQAWGIKNALGGIIDNNVPENDMFPVGTQVEFVAPDKTTYKGRVASKSGADYIVEITDGESYLVPENRLAKVTPESEQVKEAMSRYVAPTIELVSKPAIEMANRCCARIAYRDRRPSDDDLTKWAGEHYPDWRLVDAIEGDNREIGLIFEVLAAEDVKPQGGDQVNRGRALSSEPIEGSGVVATDGKEPVFKKDPTAHRASIVSFDDIQPNQFVLGKVVAHTENTEAKNIAISLAKAGAWVCGGAVRDLFLGENPSDIDIFVPKADANKWFDYLRKSGFEQKRRKFYANNVIIDVVSTKHSSPKDIVEGFDCNVCQWWIDKEGSFVPLNDDVKIATVRKEALFDLNKDLFGSSRKRAEKLQKRGWKITAQYQWTDVSDADDYRDTGYSKDKGGEVWEIEFNLEQDLEVDPDVFNWFDMDESPILSKGPHKITVEVRYDYIDGWLDDQHQILDKDQASIEEAKASAEGWLKNIMGASSSTEEECPTCQRMRDIGQPCWWCGKSAQAEKLQKRGWKILAQGGWDEYKADTESDAEKYFKRFYPGHEPKDFGADTYKEAVESSYTDIWEHKFTTDEDIDATNEEGDIISVPVGEHFVTVESRYGYVDAWLDNLHQIILDDAPHDSQAPRVDRSRLETIKQKVEEWLKNLGVTITPYSAPTEEECPTCQRMKDIGQPCWWCGKSAQLGEPGSGEAYKDLVRAARWVLARFNDSNPSYYAVPQESEMAGEDDNRVVRLSFLLQQKDSEDKLSHLYLSRGGSIVPEDKKEPGMQPVRGFVQVDSEGNLPMVMLHTPVGPESVQKYDFNFTAEKEIEKLADYDACRVAAEEVLAEFGGYTADAQAAFEARLVKLGVDPKAKEYWGGYFKDYGKMLTRNIPRKKHETKKHETKKKKTAEVDQMTKDYWIGYFGSGEFNDGWYGEALVRDIPHRAPGETGPSPQEPASKREEIEESEPSGGGILEKKEASKQNDRYKKIASDYVGYIKEEGGKYCVKSKGNPDWSGGCYDTEKEAKNRLKQVEMFKHMSIKACMADKLPANIDFIDQMTVVGVILDDIINKRADADIEAIDFGKKQSPTSKAGPEIKDIMEIAQWALEIAREDENMNSAVYSLVYSFLNKYPNFAQQKFNKQMISEPREVGYTLFYALNQSPKALKQLKKIINKYQKQWKSKQWKGVSEQAKEWRKKEKERAKGKEPERGEGPTQWSPEEELEVELEEESAIEVQPEELEVVEEEIPAAPAKVEEEAPAVPAKVEKEAPAAPAKVEKEAPAAPTKKEKMSPEIKAEWQNLDDSTRAKILEKIKQIPGITKEQVPEALVSLIIDERTERVQEQAAQPATPAPAQPEEPFDVRKLKQERGTWMGPTTTMPQGYSLEYAAMRRRQADAAMGPTSHNAPGKDDKKDYDHKEHRTQPSKLRTRFKVNRMYSTTASADNGYIFMDLGWHSDDMKAMSDQNVQQQVISFVKGLESTKEFHDFGVMGRVRIMDFDRDAGVARIKVRCSETRGVPTLGYAGDLDEPIELSGIR